jgi:hypothetical protein
MPTWPEIGVWIHESLTTRTGDADRLCALINKTTGGDQPVAVHLTAQSSDSTPPVFLDVAVVSRTRLYGFSLLRSGAVSAVTLGLRQLTFVGVEAQQMVVVRFVSGGDLVLKFTDVPDREASLLQFAKTVIGLAWPV